MTTEKPNERQHELLASRGVMSQCRKPSGLFGRYVLWGMNRRHARLTAWGLGQVAIAPTFVALDVGCGGGRTVATLASKTPKGKVRGVDYSETSVAAARRLNREMIENGRVEIEQASVTALPYPSETFDLVTAVETHFWWSDLAGGMKEVARVLKPGGTLILIAEVYDGGKHARIVPLLRSRTTMTLLSVDGHRELLASAGLVDIRVTEEPSKGWISALGTKS